MWLKEIQTHAPKIVKVLICGNKSDLTSERVVSTEEAMEFAHEHGVGYLETSAKTSHNVHAAFSAMASTLYKQRQALDKARASKKSRTIKLEGARIDNREESAGWCC
mmetsp:Transcript_636/g.1736  ORF Transcript_636/g.1736 Transcript_636/m.1736 type:complete len:107 (-) Transcript_636:159-479(-)